MPDDPNVAAAPEDTQPTLPQPTLNPTPIVPHESDDATAKRASSLAELLTKPGDTIPKKEEKKPEPEAKKEPEPKKDDPPPETKAKEKPIKVRKGKEPPPETRPTPPVRELPKPEPTARESTPPPSEDKAFEAELFPEEAALLADARDAEKLLGDRFRGQSAKTLAFLKESAEKAAQVEKGDLDEEEFTEWYEENRPQISPLDYRAIERARVKADVEREFEPKLVEERQARWVESNAPKIEAWGENLKRDLWNESLPKELMDETAKRLAGITDQGERQKIISDVRKEYALELETAEEVTSAARNDITEFYRLMAVNPATGQPLKKRNYDTSTPEGQQHARIAAMAHEICDSFRASNSPELKRDGKWFATWQEWANMPPEQRANWWTFSNDELIARARAAVPNVVNDAIQRRKQELEARGFRRVPAAPPKKEEPPKPPRVGSSPAPRVSPPPSDASGATTIAERLASALGGNKG